MSDMKQVEADVIKALTRAGLDPFIAPNSPVVESFAGELWVELLLTDASKLDTARELLNALLGARVSRVVVRSEWKIVEPVGEPVEAYGTSGGIRAATLVPVRLTSGSARAEITVSITKLAEISLANILGRKQDLRDVARIVVEGNLKSSEFSLWDPQKEDYLEVASNTVADISRKLKKPA